MATSRALSGILNNTSARGDVHDDDRPRLTVNLGALRRNARRLMAAASRAEMMPVVKADAYGLGAAKVVRTLMDEGCTSFFVAYESQAHALRKAGLDATFYCYNARIGAGAYDQHVRPVLHCPGDLEAWPGGPCGAQVDVGMQRLGLAPSDLTRLGTYTDVAIVTCHLSDAGNPASPRNVQQQELFRSLLPSVRKAFPNARLSLSATGGVMLGVDQHEDIIRPGIGLFGGSPGMQPALEPVAALTARVLALRKVPKGTPVGYDGKWVADRDSTIATLSIGYADGLPRSLSGKGSVILNAARCPIVGAVSMDLTTVDVTDRTASVGDWAEVFGKTILLDDVAASAGTIGYEVLTGLVGRTRRLYVDV